jgi:LacI family transcriptional regulator
MWPPLTTVTWPIRAMGRIAADLLLAAAGTRPAPITGEPVTSHLTVRASTAPPS